MHKDREKVAEIRELVQGGAYVVDPGAVAEAILRRLRERHRERASQLADPEPQPGGDQAGQARCS
jgi:hypothetical protein